MTAEAGPYARVLGAAWADVDGVVRAMHDGVAVATGEARIAHGGGPLAWLAVRVLGFPPAAESVPVCVAFARAHEGETWTRHFGAHMLRSRQWAGDGLLVEQFGVLRFESALEPTGDRLNIILRRWSVLGVALPRWLGPRAKAYEASEGGVFRFFVEIRHPWIGLVIRYSGWLEPQASGP